MFKTVNEGFEWIESFTNLEKKTVQIKRYYRLDRMFRLLEAFDNPHKSCKTIHLAGSKGKGSTAVLIASALQERGYKTGLYTSPHLLCYQERIRINLRMAEDAVYLEELNRIHDRLTGSVLSLPGGDEPTTFELLTLLGFLVFETQKCDWAVIETGLGGRLDATNTVTPQVAVITPIEKEHTQWLGNTLQEIAGEKAGIIKPGIPVVSARQEPVVREVLERTCREREAAFLSAADDLRITDVRTDLKGTRGLLSWKDSEPQEILLRMIGRIQLDNAATALLALRLADPSTEERLWIQGFRRAFLPGRMHLLSEHPLVVADGAHTPKSLGLAMEDFRRLAGPPPAVLLFACGDDKDIEGMAALGASFFTEIVITKPGYFKKSDPRRVEEIFRRYHSRVHFEESPPRALALVREKFPETPVLIAGSFFLAGELVGLYEKQKNDEERS